MRSPFKLLEDSFVCFHSKFSTLLSIFLIPGILITVLDNLSSPDDSSSLLYGIDLTHNNLDLKIGILSVVASACISFFLYIALLKAIASPAKLSEAYAFARKKFAPYVYVSIMQTVIFLSGIVLLIIPAILWMIWYKFATQIVLFEDKRGIEALKASKAYVKGRWFAVFGRALYGFVVIIIFGMLVAGVVTLFLSLFLTSEPIISLIGYFVAGVFIVPLMLIYNYLLYMDVRASMTPNEQEMSLADITDRPDSTVVTNQSES